MLRPLVFPTVVLFLLAFTAACEDPSNVGIDLVGNQGGDPVVVNVPPAVFEIEPISDITGTTTQILRTLSGRVEDPLLGTIVSTGNVDFREPAGITDVFRNGQITEATLQLVVDYAYGDTSRALTLALRDIPDEWDAAGSTADTVIQAAPEIVTEFNVSPTDSLVGIALPDAWIEAHSAEVRSENFNDDFHGFQFEPVEGDAVVGFSAIGVRLIVVSGGETASFTIAKSLSTIVRTDVPDLGPDLLALQDGVGTSVEVDFDFLADSLKDTAVSRAVFLFPTDSLTMAAQTPPGFVRPRLGELSLVGITEAGPALELIRTSPDAEGRYRFEASGLRNIVQSMVLGKSTFERFRLTVPTDDNTINAALFYRSASGLQRPEAVLTLTPPDN
ncbi:hypothetical protein [Rhodocaloribacter sp.]